MLEIRSRIIGTKKLLGGGMFTNHPMHPDYTEMDKFHAIDALCRRLGLEVVKTRLEYEVYDDHIWSRVTRRQYPIETVQRVDLNGELVYRTIKVMLYYEDVATGFWSKEMTEFQACNKVGAFERQDDFFETFIISGRPDIHEEDHVKV